MHEDMGSNLIYDLKFLRAKVSKNNVIVGRRQWQVARLKAHYFRLGVATSVKNAAKYLGLGTTSGVRRTMATIKDRIKGSKDQRRVIAMYAG